MQNRIPALPLTATFGDNLGYRFTTDLVELNADIQCSPSAPVGQDWAVQLWADNAIKIAELPLGPLFPDDLGRISVSGAAPVRIPAGERFHALSLSLVSGERGAYDCFHDRREFPRLQRFHQPCLKGSIDCRCSADDELIIEIAGIENPRDADNLSGTLALEIWSLEAPYEDQAWDGVLVASFSIGRLNGQSVWSNARFVAQNAPLPATGYLTLMLREWTPDGYATRDYRPLERPTNPSSAVEAPEVVAEVSVVEAPTVVEAPEVVAEVTVAPAPVVVEAPEVVAEVSVAPAPAVAEAPDVVAEVRVVEAPVAALDERPPVKSLGARLMEKARRLFRR